MDILSAKLVNLLDYKDKTGLRHEVAIDCPDCGRGVAFRGTCPVCGGKSWLPAGYYHAKECKRLLKNEKMMTDA